MAATHTLLLTRTPVDLKEAASADPPGVNLSSAADTIIQVLGPGRMFFRAGTTNAPSGAAGLAHGIIVNAGERVTVRADTDEFWGWTVDEVGCRIVSQTVILREYR